jgi:hypothetical protein
LRGRSATTGRSSWPFAIAGAADSPTSKHWRLLAERLQ